MSGDPRYFELIELTNAAVGTTLPPLDDNETTKDIILRAYKAAYNYALNNRTPEAEALSNALHDLWAHKPSDNLAPIVFNVNATNPNAELSFPVFDCNAPYPKDELLLPTVLNTNDPPPKDELLLPVVFDCNEFTPKAELIDPVVFDCKAFTPKAELLPPVVFDGKEVKPIDVLDIDNVPILPAF